MFADSQFPQAQAGDSQSGPDDCEARYTRGCGLPSHPLICEPKTHVIAIRQLRPFESDAVRDLVGIIWREFFGSESDSEGQCFLDEPRNLADLDDIEQTYLSGRGTFLVLVDGEQIVGTGAVGHVDDDTCELRRMFLLRDYRPMGLGRPLAEALLKIARTAGYKRIRLGRNRKLIQSYQLYRDLGFYDIPGYGDKPSQFAYYMERQL